MGSQPFDAGFRGIFPNHVPDPFPSGSLPLLSHLVHSAKQLARCNVRRLKPLVKGMLDPSLAWGLCGCDLPWINASWRRTPLPRVPDPVSASSPRRWELATIRSRCPRDPSRRPCLPSGRRCRILHLSFVLGCVAEISQSVPASIGKGIPLQKAENEGAGTADAAAGSPPERRIRPMYLRWDAAQESLQWRPTPSRRRGTKGRPIATDGLSRSRMRTKTS